MERREAPERWRGALWAALAIGPPARLTAKPCYQGPPLTEAREPNDVGPYASRRSIRPELRTLAQARPQCALSAHRPGCRRWRVM